ncbi:MAG TPA: DUF349 domain-containing protein [Flavobacterium sp.]|uniref:DUF349 domain-containing protein n=1 Tax=Flavobacterium sp. TaxID=239 RepID=UPI002F3FD787
MLEEKNDNLQQADGNLTTDSIESIQDDSTIVETTPVTETSEPEITDSEADIAAVTTEEKVADTTPLIENQNQKALNSINDSNAEESEDETLKERHQIPMQDYDTLSMEALVDELDTLVSTEKVMSIKEHVEEIKKAFLAKYNHFIEEKKEEYHTENPDTTEDFQYHSPLKTKFDQIYSHFRDNRNTHFKSLQTNLKTNLENRLAIVEELKELINPQENIKDTLKHFNELRERWKNAGPIPKDKYNHVWNNYHFHVENFYDYLHLDREARDLDFKHNLEQKQKIVARVQELINEADVNKAFRELQDLHRIWKEDIGPVSRENRDLIWNQFSELTKQMHDKREVLFEKLRGTELENLETKKGIIADIEVLATVKVNAHSQWLQQIEKVETLRTAFFSAGKVPSEVNEQTWAAFKLAVRNFNSFKNSFYKDIKKEQNENLSKKNALVAKAQELQESTDFAVTTPIMKRIQDEWKQIGHVPRKYSDKIWKEFKDACNHYFDKLKEHKDEDSAEEIAAFDNKKLYLETLRAYELTGDHKTDLDAIKLHIETWKNFGKVPFPRRHIEGKFNKILDALFDKLSLSKKDTDMIRFANRMDSLSENNDSRKLENEKIFIMRKIEEVRNEIIQLENNIQFFTNTRNAKKENSIVLEVRKNIAIHKESLETWQEKLKQLRNLK